MKLKKMCKGWLALAAASAVLFSFSACGENKNSGTEAASNESVAATDSIDKSGLRYIANYGNLTRYSYKTGVNPDEVYKQLTYTPEMFCGTYSYAKLYQSGTIDYKSKTAAKYYEGCGKMLIYKGGFSYNVSAVPVEITAECDSGDSGTMTMTFLSDDSRMVYAEGTFTVEENKIAFKPGEYTFAGGSDTLNLEYSFKGDALTLTNVDDSVTLNASGLIKGKKNGFSLSGESKGAQLDDIQSVNICNKSGSKCFDITLNSGDSVRNAVGYFYENGIFNLSWTDESGEVHCYELVYFMGGNKGIVLTDGKEIYRFA